MENGSRDMSFIRVGKKIFLTCPDDSIDYAVMEKEVQSGSYLGEDDIVRLEDRYGRVE